MLEENQNSPSMGETGDPDFQDALTWEDSFAIARTLRLRYPAVDLEEISLDRIYHWTVALPEFQDDPALANDSILSAIVQEWIEEAE